jgi:hypothetical protein
MVHTCSEKSGVSGSVQVEPFVDWCIPLPAEKGYGEHQLSPCSGHEEWQVHTWVPLHHQDLATWEGQAGYPSQQCTPTEVSCVDSKQGPGVF